MRFSPGRPTSDEIFRLQLIANAAFVAHEGQKAKFLADWLAGSKRRKVIYVFDTSIIVALCAPWRNGPSLDQRPDGVGQILPLRPLSMMSVNDRHAQIDDEAQRAEAVAWVLADRALRTAAKTGAPILQTNAHFKETLGVYEVVKRRAEAEVKTDFQSSRMRLNAMLEKLLQVYSHSIRNAQEIKDLERDPAIFLSRIVRTIRERELSRKSHSVREWDSFMDVVYHRGGVYRCSEFRPELTSYPDDNPSVIDVFRELAPETKRAAGALARKRELFMPIVRGSKPRASIEQVVADAEAVAEISYLSERLNAVDPDMKVVLVSADRSLVTAMALHDRNGRGEKADFSFNHIHHLWSFVDRISDDAIPVAMNPDDDINFKEPELFSGLLAFNSESRNDERYSYAESLIRNSTDPDVELAARMLPSDIDEAYKRWHRFSRRAASFHRYLAFDELQISAIAKTLRDKISTVSKATPTAPLNGEDLAQLSAETIARARDLSNVQFSGLGASSLLDAHKNGIRNPPDLMFDSLPITDSIFRDLARPRRVFHTARDFAARFEMIAEEAYSPTSDDDDDYRQLCYLKYLVLGALFASANRWVVAGQHASNAAQIVERARLAGSPVQVKKPKTNISGREAYYLMAVARRITAHQDDDFVEAFKLLRKAASCLEEDQSGRVEIDIPKIRFTSEELALELGRYYNAREDNTDLPCDTEFERVQSAARRLLLRMSLSSQDSPGAGHSFTVRRTTRTNIAVNLVQVAVIVEFRRRSQFRREDEISISEEVLRSALDEIIEHTDIRHVLTKIGIQHNFEDSLSDKEVMCSPLTLIYFVVGCALLDDPRIWVPTETGQIDTIFSQNREAVQITRYDRNRYRRLKKLALEIMSGRD